ncbi:MAG: hypothetical protein mread185_000604 [Mycoplasmataceae bacterium]|nr:MAG: hypothetical protein mread185_000170 [Mycoplasmataceae bacterium]WNE40872.1 MAG: hypothetical protein mread185_000329 [Mycoplasmataceae bacterium]WNE41147.1 MAG: hypothetical protein mread185_000604 [Mycoplasmataceae bacterium]
MAKKITIEGLEFTRNDHEDFSISVEDEYGETAIIDDITKYEEEGLSFRESTNQDILAKVDAILNSEVAQQIVKELNIQISQAYQQHN